MFRCYSYTIIRERINLCLLNLQFSGVAESTAEQCNIQTPIRTQYMQLHHHRSNHTPMYFNGLF